MIAECYDAIPLVVHYGSISLLSRVAVDLVNEYMHTGHDTFPSCVKCLPVSAADCRKTHTQLFCISLISVG